MKRAGAVLALWLAFIAAAVLVIVQTTFTADLSAFLPRSPTPAQQILVEQLRDGVVSRLMLIGLSGEPALLADQSRALAKKLRADQNFVAVENGEDTGSEAERNYFWDNRYVLSPAVTAEHFSTESLHQLLTEDMTTLASSAGSLTSALLPHDPTGEMMTLIGSFEGQRQPATRDGVWFSKDGSRALILTQTRASGSDIDAQETAVKAIQTAFAEARGASATAMVVTGPGIFAVQTRERIKSDATRLSMIATGLVVVLLTLLYRSPRVVALGLLPVVSGALAGIAAVSLGFGSVHGITLGFGVTLIGEGVDYAIYLFTQIAPGATPQSTLLRIWPTLRLGVLTSICGFSAMLFAGFPGLAQLGLFSIAGLIVAVTVTRFVLLILLPKNFSAPAVTWLAPKANAIAHQLPKLRYAMVLVVLGACAVVGSRYGRLTSTELSSLSPVPLADQKLDESLRNDVGAPDVRYLVVVSGDDQQSVLRESEAVAARLQPLVEQHVIAGFDSPATFLPSAATQKARQAALPFDPVLRSRLADAERGFGFRPNTFDGFLADMAIARHRPLLDRASLEGTRLALKVDSLLIHRTRGDAAMLPLRGVTQTAPLAAALAALPADAVTLIDLKEESDTLYSSYLRDVIAFSLAGVAVIVVLLAVSLRSVKRVLAVLAPLAAAVLVTMAAVLLTGEKLSLFHLVGLLLVVAVGSNYALFFDRQLTGIEGRDRTVVSLLFANLATVIGFGILSVSKVPVLSDIGTTVGLGAVLSLLFAAMLVPRAGGSAAGTREATSAS